MRIPTIGKLTFVYLLLLPFLVLSNTYSSLTIVDQVVQPSCFGTDDGIIRITITGGQPPYDINWTADNGFVGDSAKIENLMPGTYSVEVTDAMGCQGMLSDIMIVPPLPLSLTTTTTTPLCPNESTGTIEVTASGGAPPYQYSIDNQSFQSSDRIIGLTSGGYNVFVRDANGCITSSTAQITAPSTGLIDLGPDTTAFFGQKIFVNPDVQIDSQIVSIEWSGSDLTYLSCLECLTPNIGPVDKTLTYTVKVVDKNGCVYTDNIVILVNILNYVNVPTAFTPNGDSENDILQVFGAKNTIIKEFLVFDRNGTLMFQLEDFPINDVNIGWDGNTNSGNPAAFGTYLWVASVVYPNGQTVRESGSTNLIR